MSGYAPLSVSHSLPWRRTWTPRAQPASSIESSTERDTVACSATVDNEDLFGQILLCLLPLPSSVSCIIVVYKC